MSRTVSTVFLPIATGVLFSRIRDRYQAVSVRGFFVLRIVVLFCVLFLSACARPGPATLALVAPLPDAKTVSILVASNRVPAKDDFQSFTSGRSDRLHYLEVTVSIPPGHKAPNIEWPTAKPDPRTSFAVVAHRNLTKTEFISRAKERAKETPTGIFVHGYNYSYQEALFRLAQMAADSSAADVPILFDWPSQGSATGYLADRDSAAFARDDLASVLTDLGRADVRSIVLAHSMGAWLAVEAVRQLSLTGRKDGLSKIDQIVLAAPDIDVDLLSKQLAMTGRLKNPIVILAAKDDLALNLSRRLAGSEFNAGALDVNDPRTRALAVRENLQIIDISSLPSANGSNHDRFAALAAAYPQLRNERIANPVAGTGSLVLNGVGAVVSAPFRLGGALLSQ
jgi:esterase/lipase superfamily enzyme